ncbi:MAG: DUF433 domain-containing protein [Acidobacteria bacterium]|nr:DUF433 domain-containing protein [Acidobacteriota bacterium]
MIETTETNQTSSPTGPAPSVPPPKSYIEVRHGGYYIAGTRISLASVVYAFREGLSPETIQRDCFSLLTLEQVYGAIAFYLAHQSEIDAYLETMQAEYEAARQRDREADPEFCQTWAARRQQWQSGTQTP